MTAGMTSRAIDAFNTQNTVAVEAGPGAQAALDAAEAACARFERLFSHTLPGGDLVRVNGAGGAAVPVDPELAELLHAALGYCAETGGLFDVTVGPLAALWDFKRAQVPQPEEIERALAHVNWRGVAVGRAADGTPTVQLADPESRLVLGGVAKGWIADGLLAVLAAHGVRHAMVNLGGNVAVAGGRPDGKPWQVGIRAPRSSAEAAEAPFAAVGLEAGSVVTSGVYERAFTAPDGTLCHHILDPRTGRPAVTDLVSATLVSERSLDGDGYTTALVVMGLDRALAFVEARPGLEAVLVAGDGQVYATSGIRDGRIPFRLL